VLSRARSSRCILLPYLARSDPSPPVFLRCSLSLAHLASALWAPRFAEKRRVVIRVVPLSPPLPLSFVSSTRLRLVQWPIHPPCAFARHCTSFARSLKNSACASPPPLFPSPYSGLRKEGRWLTGCWLTHSSCCPRHCRHDRPARDNTDSKQRHSAPAACRSGGVYEVDGVAMNCQHMGAN